MSEADPGFHTSNDSSCLGAMTKSCFMLFNGFIRLLGIMHALNPLKRTGGFSFFQLVISLTIIIMLVLMFN